MWSSTLFVFVSKAFARVYMCCWLLCQCADAKCCYCSFSQCVAKADLDRLPMQSAFTFSSWCPFIIVYSGIDSIIPQGAMCRSIFRTWSLKTVLPLCKSSLIQARPYEPPDRWCGALRGCLAVKFYSCNNLLSSVHTLLVNILQYVRLYIKRKYYYYYYYFLLHLINDSILCRWLCLLGVVCDIYNRFNSCYVLAFSDTRRWERVCAVDQHHIFWEFSSALCCPILRFFTMHFLPEAVLMQLVGAL